MATEFSIQYINPHTNRPDGHMEILSLTMMHRGGGGLKAKLWLWFLLSSRIFKGN